MSGRQDVADKKFCWCPAGSIETGRFEPTFDWSDMGFAVIGRLFGGAHITEGKPKMIDQLMGHQPNSSANVSGRRLTIAFMVLALRIAPTARAQPALTTLWSFGDTNTDGMLLFSGVISDKSGNLYGTTFLGGAYGDGTVFEYTNGVVQTVASFNGTNGNGPRAGLVMDPAGDLFGTTQFGGQNSDGTVFEIPAGSDAINSIASFNGTNGDSPICNLLLDSAGDLYGTTYSGDTTGGAGSSGGVIFKIKAGTDTITPLVSFPSYGAYNSHAGLNADNSGNLYGTTELGGGSLSGIGSGMSGTVFKYTENSNTYTQLASFNVTNGGNPEAGLIADSSGNLFGTTEGGGPNGGGTIFKLNPVTDTLTTLFAFGPSNGPSSGYDPWSGLIIDTAGNLYGIWPTPRGISSARRASAVRMVC
jgi:uncharacterized repeat protein (TIGR03803 family)